MSWYLFNRIVLIAGLLGLVFCVSMLFLETAHGGIENSPPGGLRNFGVRLELSDVRGAAFQKLVRERIAAVSGVTIKSVGGTDVDPVYSIVVRNVYALDELHRAVEHAERLQSWRQKTAGVRPSFGLGDITIAYGSAHIDGTTECIVDFDVRPGSRVWYKIGGRDGREREITDSVDAGGHVRMRLPIAYGDKNVFARAQFAGVNRYLRIGIFTRDVDSIEDWEYDDEAERALRN